MDWKKVERFLSAGQAFVPVNAENKGDSVQLYFKDGSIELLDMQSDTFFPSCSIILAQASLLIGIDMENWLEKSSSFPLYCLMGLR